MESKRATLAPIPRRERLPEGGGTRTPSRIRSSELPPPGLARSLAAAARWSRAGLRFFLGVAADRARGRATAAGHGLRLRRILEGMGGTAIKVGHQIALRIDLLPFEICNELARMPDRAPPLAIAHALARIEAATGRPLAEVYEAVDPEPIVSDTVSCVYQAVLRSGERVAIKVRRPDLLLRLSADLRALGWLLALLEALTLVRPGFFAGLEDELRDKLGEELDFVIMARYQRLFRARARRARIRYLSAARVYRQLSGPDVMVSEFISGVWYDEVIQAQESGDAATLARLRLKGIRPRELARRMAQAAWWGMFENAFFLVDPQAARIVVEPGNRIVFVDLGEVGRASTRTRELYREALERLSTRDVSGAMDVLVQSLSPLPYIDVHTFRAHIEQALWQRLLAMIHRESPWWERTTAGLWLTLLQAAQEYGIPVRLEVLRLMRSCIQHDFLAARLWPQIRPLSEFDRYLFGADRRLIRRNEREDWKERRVRRRAVRVGMATALERFRRLRFLFQSRTQKLPISFLSLSSKGAFALSAVLHTVAGALALAVVASVLLFLRRGLLGEDVDLVAVAAEAVRSPYFLAFLVVPAYLAYRRVMHRLGDREPHA